MKEATLDRDPTPKPTAGEALELVKKVRRGFNFGAEDSKMARDLDAAIPRLQAALAKGAEDRQALVDRLATAAAIHSRYPATTAEDRAYGEGRRAAAQAVRDAARQEEPPDADR